MGAFKSAVITKKGQELLAKVVAGTTKLERYSHLPLRYCRGSLQPVDRLHKVLSFLHNNPALRSA